MSAGSWQNLVKVILGESKQKEKVWELDQVSW